LANTASAKKQMRSSRRKRERNRVLRSRARTYIKKVKALIEEGRIDEAREMARLAYSALDKAVAKGVIHRNKAARHKSRLMKRLEQAAKSLEAA